jgi:hypothetical protein
MWTVFRFALSGADHAAYEEAYELLARAGFVRVVDAVPRAAATALPGAVAADVGLDPSAITQALFEVLAAARLRPVAVTGCPAAADPAATREREPAVV